MDSIKIERQYKILLYIAPVVSSIIIFFLQDVSYKNIMANIVFGELLIGMSILFYEKEGKRICNNIENSLLIWGSLIFSIMITGTYSLGYTEMLGLAAVVVAALNVGIYFSISINLILLVQFILIVGIRDKDVYHTGSYIMFSFIVAILFSLYRESKTIIYFAGIIISVKISLSFVEFGFDIKKFQNNILVILAQVITTICFLVYAYFCRREKKECAKKHIVEVASEVMLSEASEATSEEMLTEFVKESTPELSVEELYEVYSGKEFPLYIRMNNYSKELASHSNKVSLTSFEAANYIGADAELVRCGGLYHEVGRIIDEKDYINAGEKLAREYNFPDKLCEVIRQHSTGADLPKSVEAAIVMLSDCIISTVEYIMKTEYKDKVTRESIIESVIKNRLEKGSLKYSTMTAEQLEDLKEFYINNVFDTDGGINDDII